MPSQDTPEPPARRLSDKIQAAFDQACRQGQLEVAACMLQGLYLALLSSPDSWDRRQEGLVLIRSMHGRLAQLRDAATAASPAATAQPAKAESGV